MKKFRIGIAPDSFKGSLTAEEAAQCIEDGFRRIYGRQLAPVRVPMADGGEGTVRAIVSATGGRYVRAAVSDPLGRKIRAEYGISGDGQTAIIEMAAASGLPLLNPAERNPIRTSTFGTGELILHAAKCGVSRIILGIGGSATVDGGTGMARALGIRFIDSRGMNLPGNGGSLQSIRAIDTRNIPGFLKHIRFDIACDVTNLLCGPHGAAHVFGPQKGATPAMVQVLDKGLRNLACVIDKTTGRRVALIPGSGAAGGMAVPLLSFFNARLRAGVRLVIEAVDLPCRLKGCDLVITGEGRMDGQTAYGKTPAGVARVAKKLGIPVIAICGSIGSNAARVHKVGIDAYFSALQRPMNEDELAVHGADMLTTCAEQVARLLRI